MIRIVWPSINITMMSLIVDCGLLFMRSAIELMTCWRHFQFCDRFQMGISVRNKRVFEICSCDGDHIGALHQQLTTMVVAAVRVFHDH
jgi:hypothetical protein